jgi:hypothetical protein
MFGFWEPLHTRSVKGWRRRVGRFPPGGFGDYLSVDGVAGAADFALHAGHPFAITTISFGPVQRHCAMTCPQLHFWMKCPWLIALPLSTKPKSVPCSILVIAVDTVRQHRTIFAGSIC